MNAEPSPVYRGDDGYLYSAVYLEPVFCAQFALCENRAVDVVPAPWGGTAICQRCKDKLEAL